MTYLIYTAAVLLGAGGALSIWANWRDGLPTEGLTLVGLALLLIK